jgi:DnaJ-class molecular chaperone
MYAIKNMGMTKATKRGQYGTLYIKFDIHYPDEICKSNNLADLLKQPKHSCNTDGIPLKFNLAKTNPRENVKEEQQCKQQ